MKLHLSRTISSTMIGSYLTGFLSIIIVGIRVYRWIYAVVLSQNMVLICCSFFAVLLLYFKCIIHAYQLWEEGNSCFLFLINACFLLNMVVLVVFCILCSKWISKRRENKDGTGGFAIWNISHFDSFFLPAFVFRILYWEYTTALWERMALYPKNIHLHVFQYIFLCLCLCLFRPFCAGFFFLSCQCFAEMLIHFCPGEFLALLGIEIQGRSCQIFPRNFCAN